LDIAPLLEGDPSASEPAEIREWTPDLIPEQVRLVDLLQFLEHPPFRRALRRVAVMVSAWDLLPEPAPTPQQWLRRELPLLHQFLESNSSSFMVRVFGVSAQGGQFKGEERDRLLAEIPGERILCVGDGVKPHDLTAPIAWLMSEL
jgi:hypothetical protein